MKHGSPDHENMPPDYEAVRELQRLSAWLLGLPDTWWVMFAQRSELARALLRHLVADGQGAALQKLQDGFQTAGQASDTEEVLATLDDMARSVARTIMAAWLLGRYLPPQTNGSDESVYADVMGPEVYRQSLVWHLIGATPMGVPQGGTNPWAGPPRVVT